MPAPLSRLLLFAAPACLAVLIGCEPQENHVTILNPRGGGSETTFNGRVLDDSGRAVAGAVVRAREADDLPFDLAHGDTAGAAAAITDSESLYRLDGLRAGTPQ